MTLAVSRFLESPVRWEGSPTPDERRIVLDRIKAAVAERLRGFCVRQVRERPRPEWQQAYAFRGEGSTLERKMKIEMLYERWVPIPAEEVDDAQKVQAFLDAAKSLVRGAIEATRDTLAKETDPAAEKAALRLLISRT